MCVCIAHRTGKLWNAWKSSERETQRETHDYRKTFGYFAYSYLALRVFFVIIARRLCCVVVMLFPFSSATEALESQSLCVIAICLQHGIHTVSFPVFIVLRSFLSLLFLLCSVSRSLASYRVKYNFCYCLVWCCCALLLRKFMCINFEH